MLAAGAYVAARPVKRAGKEAEGKKKVTTIEKEAAPLAATNSTYLLAAVRYPLGSRCPHHSAIIIIGTAGGAHGA